MIDQRIIIQMGSSNVRIGKQLKFIQTIEDHRFGQIDILRGEDGHYAMKIKRSFVVGDRRHTQFKKIVAWAFSQGSSLIAPIISVSSSIQNTICIQYQITQIMTEYYNYTLQNLIINKKQLDEAELWFILESLLHLTTVLRKNKIGINLALDNVFVTLKGVLCVYIQHLISFEESIQCNEYGMGQLIGIVLLQLTIGQNISIDNYQLSTKQLLVHIAKVCTKCKALGRVIKQLLNRQKSEEDVLAEIRCLAQSDHMTISKQLKLNKFKYALPELQQSKETPHPPAAQLNQASEIKIIQFKPQRKSNDAFKKINDALKMSNDSVGRNNNKFNSLLQSSQLPKEPFLVNPSDDQQRSGLKQRMGGVNGKMLMEIEERKRKNELKRCRFEMRRQELMIGVEKQNKQNAGMSYGKAVEDCGQPKLPRARRQTQRNDHAQKKNIA